MRSFQLAKQKHVWLVETYHFETNGMGYILVDKPGP